MDVEKLKLDRSRLKARVTSLSTKLKRLIDSNKQDDADATYKDLEAVFTEFIEVHEQFVEATYDDSTASVVGGLDGQAYFKLTEDLVNTTFGSYNHYCNSIKQKKAKRLEHSVTQLIESAKVLYDNSSYDPEAINKAGMLVKTIQEHYTSLNELADIVDCNLLSDIESHIHKLNLFSSNVKPKLNTHAHVSAPLENALRPSLTGGLRSSVVMAYSTPHGSSQRVQSSDLYSESLAGINTANFTASKFKKTPPPSFDGDRKKWYEFRAVWRRYAEIEYNNDEERAWALKQSLQGKASEHVKAIFVTQNNAYQRIWDRLDSIYSDISMSVQTVYKELKQLSQIREDDHRALIKFINQIELIYSELGEVSQLDGITTTQVEDIVDKLPFSIKRHWYEVYDSLTTEDKLKPFTPLMIFLEKERQIAFRMNKQGHSSTSNTSHTNHNSKTRTFHVYTDSSNCLVHNKPGTTHATADCRAFLDFSVNRRLDLLKKERACFRCLGKHHRNACNSTNTCNVCNMTSHHTLLHAEHKAKQDKQTSNSKRDTEEASSVSLHSNSHANQTSILPIQEVKSENNKVLSILYDSGSNSTYITHSAAQATKARVLGSCTLDIVTMGNKGSKLNTRMYEVKLSSDSSDKLVKITAYGIDNITSTIGRIEPDVIKNMFPNIDANLLVRTKGTVDILLGNDYCGLHPKQEICKRGEHLSVMKGTLGLCLQGTHSDLDPSTSLIINHLQLESSHVHNFILGEELGTEISPKCGGCKCNKCPLMGHTYSFKEEQELDLIRSNLTYDEKNHRWITKYPWIKDPNQLPNNYHAALNALKRTEKSLSRTPEWAQVYQGQIQDMIQRNVARKLSDEEQEAWVGPVFYINHLAVKNPNSNSTPVRIVFNSSQKYQGQSLNDALAKGPDAYLNNLLGLLIRWRENSVVIMADIRKMYNSIYMYELEQHCHRFLWRDLRVENKPDIYVIQRVNMGDRPAAAISTEAIYMTASLFKPQYPQVAKLLCRSTYVDDIVDSLDSIDEAIKLAHDTEKVLQKVGFSIKYWKFNKPVSDIPNITCNDNMIKGTDEQISVLGVKWNVKADSITFKTNLDFSQNKQQKHIETHLMMNGASMCGIPDILTKRMVLEQVMRVYDPLGILSPLTLIAKSYLRECWILKLGWDERLPQEMHEKWVGYFRQLTETNKFQYSRVLKPENTVGQPDLVILSDAGNVAYGFAAYIRWRLENGSFWCRLIIAKCRIAPQRKLSTPQLELNAAVLSKRGRKLIESECRFKFGNVYQLVDSETVLSMINKISTRFKIYEGVRVGEIQAATQGNMSCWYWISRKNNIADVLTRFTSDNLKPESEWFQGPKFLYSETNLWGLKSHKVDQDSITPHNVAQDSKSACMLVKSDITRLVNYERFNTGKKLFWTIARVISIIQNKSFRGGSTTNIKVSHLQQAKLLLLKEAQTELCMIGSKHTYKRLSPKLNEKGLWIVGNRLTAALPLFEDSTLALLPSKHPLTRLLMVDAHQSSCHRGRDATLARFRISYWTPHGSKLAGSVKHNCQLCRLREPQALGQSMGTLPVERTSKTLPFTNIMVDYFGPYTVKSEVNKRSTTKTYGVIFSDMYSRAVHVEAVYGYDTDSFLLAFRRYVSIRGWPTTIFSDQGSQLVGASKELVSIIRNLDKQTLIKKSVENGTNWHFGPADAPWNQGAVESMVKAVKRCFKFIFHNQKLFPSQFNTICYEAANILNERPLGTIPSSDSIINILTPNCLILGRALCQSSLVWDTESSKPLRHIATEICDSFWKRWTELYLPSLVVQSKWRTEKRNLVIGDVVVILDHEPLKREYHIGVITETFPSRDGKVRKVLVRYTSYKKSDKLYSYRSPVTVSRSVHKLALLVPVNAHEY